MLQRSIGTSSNGTGSPFVWVGLFACLMSAVGAASSSAQQVDERSVTAQPSLAYVGRSARDADAGRGVLYILYPATNRIVMREVAGSVEARLAARAFEVLPLRDGILDQPLAIAARWGRLLVLDAGRDAVLEVDVVGRKVRTIFSGRQIADPDAFAVSASGDIVVSDRASRSFVWIRDHEEPRVVPWARWSLGADEDSPVSASTSGTDQPTYRIQFLGTDLYVFNPRAGTMAVLNAVDQVFRTASGRGGTLASTGFVEDRPDVETWSQAVTDWSMHRGVSYVSAGGRLYVRAPVSRSDNLVRCGLCEQLRPGALLATQSQLFVQDVRDNAIVALQRPVPATIDLGSDGRRATRALAELFVQLREAGRLPVADYEAPADFDTITTALVDAQVVVATDQGINEGAYAAISDLLCELNSSICIEPTQFLARSLASGERLRLPDLSIVTSVRPRPTDLAGRTVEERVRELWGSAGYPGGMQALTEYVSLSNPGRLETELALRKFILPSPPAPFRSLVPGTLVRYTDGGRERVVGSLADCEIDVDSVRNFSDVPVPDVITTRSSHEDALRAYVPAETAPRRYTTPLAEGEEFQMAFERPHSEALDAERLRSLVRFRGAAWCLQGLGGRDSSAVTAVVVETLGVEGASFERRGRRPGDWRASIDRPYSLGYKAVPLAVLASPATDIEVEANLLEPAEAKPGRIQDILRWRTGTMTLPGPRWTLRALVPHSIIETNPATGHASPAGDRFTGDGIAVFPHELVAAVPQSGERGQPPHVSVATPEQVSDLQTSRDALLKALGFRSKALTTKHRVGAADGMHHVVRHLYAKLEPLIQRTSGMIGVLEYGNQFDLRHHGFFDGEGSNLKSAVTKYEPDTDDAILTRQQPWSDRAHWVDSAELTESHHGTHVGGLLAGRKSLHDTESANTMFGGLLQGILPRSRLYLVDLQRADHVPAGIERPGVTVFNVSQLFGHHGWAEAFAAQDRTLFVFAAGNKKEPSSEPDLMEVASAPPPIGWVDAKVFADHAIGVGATKSNGEDLLDGSNYGRRFVHIAAPGAGVFSLASRNGYGWMSGTSQATTFVTAAAAVLKSGDGALSPAQINARLLYTTDRMSADDDGKIWAGRLNFPRAVWKSSLNLLVDRNFPDDPPKSVAFDPATTIVVVPLPESVTREAEGDRTFERKDLTVVLEDVLRIIRLKGERGFRIFYRNSVDQRFEILDRVNLHGELQCLPLPTGEFVREWDGEAFVPPTPPGAKPWWCNRRDLSDVVMDYVAAIPDDVTFAPE